MFRQNKRGTLEEYMPPECQTIVQIAKSSGWTWRRQ